MLNILTKSINNDINKERINSLFQTSNHKITFDERLFLEECNDILYMYNSVGLDEFKTEYLRQIYVKYSN